MSDQYLVRRSRTIFLLTRTEERRKGQPVPGMQPTAYV